MPIRYITIPKPITLIDPITREPLRVPGGADPEKSVSFEDLVIRLMTNPMWGESYHNIKAQAEIMTELTRAKANGGVVALAEEDWQRLKQAAEFPKPNIGWNPVLAYQLLPLITAIIDAPAKDPRPEKDAPAKE